MKMTVKEVEKLLLGEKTEHRVLVKEGDLFFGYPETGQGFIMGNNNKPKWGVGNDYAVQTGKKGIWYCPKCNEELEELDRRNIADEMVYNCNCNGRQFDCVISGEEVSAMGSFARAKKLNFEVKGWKPLRVVLKSIRKEKLLEVSEVDAKKEGNFSKKEFLIDFYETNAKQIPRNLIINNDGLFDAVGTLKKWNPFVWVRKIEVMK